MSIGIGSDDSLETRVVRAPLTDLVLLEKNARFMPATQYRRLVDNIKRDGGLTSVPLVVRVGNKLRVLSGNHRVRAARDAGLAEIEVMEILTPITEERQRAMQLAHNAIAGQDDAQLLAEIYDSLSLFEREYSGLTDDAFKAFDPLKLGSLNVGIDHEEVLLLFLPADREAFRSSLRHIEKAARKRPVLVAAYADFDGFFDGVVAAKKAKNVFNVALAVKVMADVAAEHFGQATAAEAGKE